MSSPTPTDPLDQCRRRIETAFDPALLEQAGHRLIEQLGAHFAKVEAGKTAVLNWADPPTNVRDARTMLDAAPDKAERTPTEQLDRFAELVRQSLSRGLNLHHPHYVGHQVPAPVPLAGLFDAMGSVTNQCMAIYEMGPWATAIERATIETIGEQVGFPVGQFAGLVTHGGSLANLTGLLTARNVCLPECWTGGVSSPDSMLTVVAHADAHYSAIRAAGILGLGTQQVVKAALDERRRMDPQQLDEQLTELKRQGRRIIAVIGCACATPIGAFDPVEEIAEVCSRHGIWLHVDAAHGGAACFSRRHRHLVAGLPLADSVVLDAHKMMFMPALCAYVFYKNPEHRFSAFHQDAPYLFDPSNPGMAEYDSGMKTIECTKRAAALGVWGVWSMFGPQLFSDMVDVTFDLGRRFYEKLSAADDFEPLHEPQCNIVAFRYVPKVLQLAPPKALGEFQLALRRAVIESGEFYLVPTQFAGTGALRVTLINPLTTDADLDNLLQTLRRYGAELMKR